MGLTATTARLTYARNDYIKQGRSHIFDKCADMIYYACLQQFGKEYWVDATSGSSSNNGGDYLSALDTISDAITLSNADVAITDNHTNRIFITGGTYTESLTTAAAQCDLIGLDPNREGWSPQIAGKMVFSSGYGMRLFNLQLRPASAGDEAITISGTCHGFEVHNCEFRAPADSTGYGYYQDGNAYYVKIKNCQFTNCWDYGIYIDALCKGLEFENNFINAKTCGIYLSDNVGSPFDGLIKGNQICRMDVNSSTALTTGIHVVPGDRTVRIMICGNYVGATDAINRVHDDPAYLDDMLTIGNQVVNANDALWETGH